MKDASLSMNINFFYIASSRRMLEKHIAGLESILIRRRLFWYITTSQSVAILNVAEVRY